jgi:hypothetical protein
MAKRKPIVIDGDIIDVTPTATLADVVSPNVLSVTTHSGQLINRERFAQVPVPEGFETNHSAINKGGEDIKGASVTAAGQVACREDLRQ